MQKRKGCTPLMFKGSIIIVLSTLSPLDGTRMSKVLVIVCRNKNELVRHLFDEKWRWYVASK